MVNFGKIGRIVVGLVWMLAVLAWPVLKWVVSINVFLHFLRMIYHWETPGIYPGWMFVSHFLALTALTYFVSNYKPKGL